ncbi:sn-glycerol-3-phosphate import ATP-binding protein UgpC [Amorphus coralli]|uniref:sn-glycerol-3-phosphate import ATP-binding protein UgpC n=1 Tax=Amorphus coralli TaxID=340680 RepID=UPI00036CFCF3|nr:sn-glycerol-3-phosphate import ATP-binding protein UgpC [Amorphus coralli]
MAGIVVDRVRKVYPNGYEAIKSLSLDMADGELVVLVGPSGCGKSTLLRMIAGLETVTDGTIAIGDRVVNEVEPGERDIAMVFQNYALYPHMSVYDNLAYGLRNRRTPKDEIDRRVRAAADMLGVASLLDRKPRQMSGGQRQRVAMGRAIVREPAVFLFDEPLSNLDAKLRVQMRVEIKKLQRKLATTSVYVTHDQLEAMTLADKLVVMNAGAVEQVGTPMELYDRPASVFVATFIGSPAMNTLPGTVSNGHLHLGGAATNGNGGRPELPVDAPAGPVTVGVRPEHLVLGGLPDGMQGLDLAFGVTTVEPVGAESLIHCERPDGTGLIVRAHGTHRIAPDSLVHCHAPPEALHLFDRETGARLAG